MSANEWVWAYRKAGSPGRAEVDSEFAMEGSHVEVLRPERALSPEGTILKPLVRCVARASFAIPDTRRIARPEGLRSMVNEPRGDRLRGAWHQIKRLGPS